MYGIRVDYITGDSFRSEHIYGEDIGIAISDIDKAKENLKRIKEHYFEFQDGPNRGRHEPLKLLLDEKEDVILYPFWIGYFETLLGAEVYSLEDNGMRFEL
jgi:hypothetical protein